MLPAPGEGAAAAATGEPGAESIHPVAPWGRRLCEVTGNRASGGYRVFSLRDAEGPEPLPGQFYMLATERRWEERGKRPFLPRAFSVAGTEPVTGAGSAVSSRFVSHGATKGELSGVRLDFLAEGVGPGSDRLCALEPGEWVWANGPLGSSFSAPRELSPGAAGAILVGGGVGIAPLALLRRRFAARNVPTRVLLGFRDEAHSGGLDDLFACREPSRGASHDLTPSSASRGRSLCPEVGLASEDGHVGHRGYVTDLLEAMLVGDDATSAAVYACGPPPMLDAVAVLCAERGVACELAMEAPMACGFGACYGCAVPTADGGYMRLCVDGPVVRTETVGFRPAGPVAAGDPPPPAVAEASSGAVPPAAPPAGEAATQDPAPRSGAMAAGGEGGGVHPRSGVLFFAPTTPADSQGVGGEKPSKRMDTPTLPQSSAVEFCGIELEHPVINASGTFDAIAARRVYGDAVLEEFPFAAFVSKTITVEARAGNEPRRIWETPAGMINSIGLPNKGLEGFLGEDLPRLAELPVPLIVSVMGTSREEFARLVEGIAERDEVAAIELNVSCPNVRSGLIVGEQPGETAALLEALRPLTSKPLIVKLTPNVADPAAVAVAAERSGADAVSLINTLKASAIDPGTGRPGIAAGHGGLSGPAVRPIAVAQIRAVATAVDVPVVGMGGVCGGEDAFEMICAGAALVAVGTESFRDPRAGLRIAAELLERSQWQGGGLNLDSRSR
jgi:dihydroorotate dehydrogenase (NAD+) catalytic subunit